MLGWSSMARSLASRQMCGWLRGCLAWNSTHALPKESFPALVRREAAQLKLEVNAEHLGPTSRQEPGSCRSNHEGVSWGSPHAGLMVGVVGDRALTCLKAYPSALTETTP